jgi:hypothetical protein
VQRTFCVTIVCRYFESMSAVMSPSSFCLHLSLLLTCVHIGFRSPFRTHPHVLATNYARWLCAMPSRSPSSAATMRPSNSGKIFQQSIVFVDRLLCCSALTAPVGPALRAMVVLVWGPASLASCNQHSLPLQDLSCHPCLLIAILAFFMGSLK